VRQSLFSLFFIVVLSSCTQQIQNIKNISGLSKPQQKLAKISNNWNLSGKISIISEHENWHARFYWLKQAHQFQLRFTGPLGETYLLLEQKVLGETKQNTLKIANEVYFNQGNVEDLLAKYSKIPIPINSLQHWIFGQYNPHQPYHLKMLTIEKDIDVIAELYQQDWKIQFSRYKQQLVEQQSAFFFPSKMVAKNDDYSIKVFVSSRNLTH
jgi:outer membrane lipoprotein LolB